MEVQEKQQALLAKLKNTTVYADVTACIKGWFENMPEGDTIVISNGALIKKLKDHFIDKYDAEAVALLLRKGFADGGGNFTFKKDDFIKTFPNRLEGIMP